MHHDHHLAQRADAQVCKLMSMLSCSDHLMEEDFSSLLVTDFLGHAPAAKPTVARPVHVGLGDVLGQTAPRISSSTRDACPGSVVGDFAWKQYVK